MEVKGCVAESWLYVHAGFHGHKNAKMLSSFQVIRCALVVLKLLAWSAVSFCTTFGLQLV